MALGSFEAIFRIRVKSTKSTIRQELILKVLLSKAKA